MPETSAAARTELTDMIYEARLTRKQVALELGRTEAWLSRRLAGTNKSIDIDSYNQIKKTVQSLIAKK